MDQNLFEAKRVKQYVHDPKNHEQIVIHDVQYDYFGNRMATCSSDGWIHIYDMSNQEEIKQADQFKAHDSNIWQIHWAPPKFGSLICCCSYDGCVSVFQEDKSKETNQWIKIQYYQKHQASVNSIQWAPQEFGLKLVAASSDKCISILSKKDQSDQWEPVYKITDAHDSGINSVVWQLFKPAN